jgi:putative membrane protein
MRNIIRIFTSDVKRLATNVVAVVVIMGLAVIPSLYAWFNIMSNWDPYGEASTTNLNVVVASMDEGTEIEGIEINVGNIIVSNLKENDTIGWVFVDTEEEAVDGVYSGDYYAALVIDEEFTEDLISFLGGDLENPKITYYENEKKNAIAPKITGKVKTTVQEEIDTAFVSTLAETILELSDYVATSDPDSSLTDSVLDKLYDLDDDMQTYITIMDSYISIIDATDSLMDATNQVTDQLDSIMETGRSLANSADAAADSAEDALDTTSDLISVNLSDLQKTMSSFQKTVDDVLDGIQSTGDVGEKQVEALRVAVDALHSRFNTTMDSVTIVDQSAKTDVDAKTKAVSDDFDKIDADLLALEDASEKTSTDTKALAKEVQEDFDACNKSLDELYDTYNDVVDPQLSNTMNSIQDSILEIERILNYSSDSIDDVSSALDSYPDMMSFGKERLVTTRDEALDLESKLLDLIADVEDMEGNDQYNTLMALIESDPEVIADFISSPVNLDQEPIYGVENNGSATAPFYIVLSIWFGALILIAIMHTGLKTNPGCKNLKNYQKFFGRYIVFYLVGQLQTIITVLGSLLYVGIQCEHPFLFWLAASITSFTFTLFMYSLSYAFGNVGEALAVVLMVIQVAGSGGTFPVEVLPWVFQILYKYMPFAYGMNAMRETIAGMHGNDYWGYLAGMLIYIGLALLFGLIISIPYAKLNDMIEESKEKTDLLV